MHTVLVVMVLLFITTFICYYYAKHKSKLKKNKNFHTTNLKMENNDNHMCYYFDHIIKFQAFNYDNILIYEKSQKNTLIYNIYYKILIGAKPLHIRFNKIDGFVTVYEEVDI